ncbi:MAG: hypothetical protein AAFQ15_01830 [Pseudomonadota bacterium]
MWPRTFLMSAALLAMPTLMVLPTWAEAAEKSEARGIMLSYEGEHLKAENPKVFVERLLDGLLVQSNAEAISLHFVAVKGGRAVVSHSSHEVALRRRPGRMKMVRSEAFPSPEFFEGLAVKGFIVPKSKGQLIGEMSLNKKAEAAFGSIGQADGIFVVATFDDMIKVDETRGLVGFGSWN